MCKQPRGLWTVHRHSSPFVSKEATLTAGSRHMHAHTGAHWLQLRAGITRVDTGIFLLKLPVTSHLCQQSAFFL